MKLSIEDIIVNILCEHFGVTLISHRNIFDGLCYVKETKDKAYHCIVEWYK